MMTRYEEYSTCPACDGDGAIETAMPQRDDPYYARVDKCEACNGSGVRWNGGGPTEKDPNRPYCKPDQSCCDWCCGN